MQPTAQSLHIGMTAALTGRYSLPGQQALLGVQAWLEDVNQAGGIWLQEHTRCFPLQLTCYDDASNVEQCRVSVERLLRDDRVHVLLGPYSSGLALRAAEVAERYQTILWNHSGSSEAIYRRGFRWLVGILSPPGTYFHSVIDYIRHTMPQARRVAIVHSTAGAFPMDVATGAVQYCQQYGLTDVHTYPYPAALSNFHDILTALRTMAPEVVLSVGRIEDDLRFAVQWCQYAVPAIAVGLIVTPMTLFRDTLGEDAGRFLGPSQWEPTSVTLPDYGPSSQEVARRLLARHPAGVDYPMAQGYVGGLVLQHCLETAGTLDQHRLREVAGRLDFTTFYGRYRLDPQTGRQIGHSMPVVQWQHGQRIVVWPG
ncbi:MAG: hypothetical protein FJZ47_03245 [Candidatus Tectomicrobia bacterium]|uniref:Leucine-binding protein domain-containing protein n=1 Tax=Tectimicrobiota bacterium TaxID=2528274 RepID=A0A938AZN5_UNCTE|nr:hypothetical protein [Candidatus Tectomicrobia bacterium]